LEPGGREKAWKPGKSDQGFSRQHKLQGRYTKKAKPRHRTPRQGSKEKNSKKFGTALKEDQVRKETEHSPGLEII